MSNKNKLLSITLTLLMTPVVASQEPTGIMDEIRTKAGEIGSIVETTIQKVDKLYEGGFKDSLQYRRIMDEKSPLKERLEILESTAIPKSEADKNRMKALRIADTYNNLVLENIPKEITFKSLEKIRQIEDGILLLIDESENQLMNPNNSQVLSELKEIANDISSKKNRLRVLPNAILLELRDMMDRNTQRTIAEAEAQAQAAQLTARTRAEARARAAEIEATMEKAEKASAMTAITKLKATMEKAVAEAARAERTRAAEAARAATQIADLQAQLQAAQERADRESS